MASRETDLNIMIIMEMDKGEDNKIEEENNIITTKHMKKTRITRKTKTQNKTRTIIMGGIIDKIRMDNT